MSTSPTTTSAATLSADRKYLTRQHMSIGYQFFSLIMPLAYTAFVFSRRRVVAKPWNLNSMLRTTWLGGITGIVQGGALEYLRTSYESEDSIRIRRINAMYNLSLLRAQDHSTIGAILGAALTPALFWKRARAIHLFLGGAGLGAGTGLVVHWVRNLTEGPLPPGPKIAPPSASVLTLTP